MNRRTDYNQHAYQRLHQVSVVINGFIIGCIVALFVLVLAFPKGWATQAPDMDHSRTQASADLAC